MDAAVELAKCWEAAEKAVKYLIGVVDPALAGKTTERFATALLGARADALRESDLPYLAEFGPGEAYRMSEELMAEARARRVRGL